MRSTVSSRACASGRHRPEPLEQVAPEGDRVAADEARQPVDRPEGADRQVAVHERAGAQGRHAGQVGERLTDTRPEGGAPCVVERSEKQVAALDRGGRR